MSFEVSKLSDFIRSVPDISRIVIAYSGGLDSSVLLHALARLRDQLSVELLAVHVHHGLLAEADAWVDHCRAVCEKLAVSLQVEYVDAAPAAGESPEAKAREVRYAAIGGLLRQGDLLLTAQHRDDQAETLLLQLFRGSGPRGLAAMPVLSEFGPARQARPLLACTRAELQAWAEQQGIDWVEDPSNTQTIYDRNFLRRQVMPVLQQRWPGLSGTLSRAATLQAEQAVLARALAKIDFEQVVTTPGGALSVTALLQLAPERQRNLLRYWIGRQGLPLPACTHIEQIMVQLSDAADDAMPCISWPGAETRRFQDQLFVMPPQPAHACDQVLDWDASQPLYIASLQRSLLAEPVEGEGLSRSALHQGPVSVRFRQGGESIRPAAQAHTRQLKKLLQEQGIPAWERDRIPLVYIGEELAAVAGLWVSQGFMTAPGEAGVRLIWPINSGF